MVSLLILRAALKVLELTLDFVTVFNDVLVELVSLSERELDGGLLVVVWHEFDVVDDRGKQFRPLGQHAVGEMVHVREVQVQMVEARVIVEVYSYLVHWHLEVLRHLLGAHALHFLQKRKVGGVKVSQPAEVPSFDEREHVEVFFHLRACGEVQAKGEARFRIFVLVDRFLGFGVFVQDVVDPVQLGLRDRALILSRDGRVELRGLGDQPRLAHRVLVDDSVVCWIDDLAGDRVEARVIGLQLEFVEDVVLSVSRTQNGLPRVRTQLSLVS